MFQVAYVMLSTKQFTITSLLLLVNGPSLLKLLETFFSHSIKTEYLLLFCIVCVTATAEYNSCYPQSIQSSLIHVADVIVMQFIAEVYRSIKYQNHLLKSLLYIMIMSNLQPPCGKCTLNYIRLHLA